MAPASRTTQAMTEAGLNLIQQALSIYDSDLNLVVCNSRFREMFGLPDALLSPGASFGDTIRHLAARGEYGEVGDLDAFVSDRVDQARAFEAHYFERQRANGRWISVEGSPLPGGGWVAVYTDITRTKAQETLLRARSDALSDRLLRHTEELAAANRKLEATVTALEEAKRQLTESEARTRLTTEMMPAHIAHVGPDLRYTYSNQRLSTVIPGRPSHIVGMHVADALGAAAYEKIWPHLDRAFDGIANVVEFTDTPSSKRIRTAFTPDSETGTDRGAYILSMDITEETQARAALQQTRRRELAAQMTSGLAHDFSNLLTIILGLQSQLARMTLPTEARSLVTATTAAARRGGNLLNRIADMTSQRMPRMQATDIGALLADLRTLASPSLPVGISFETTDETGGTTCLIDPGMLQDALLNLIFNARDACGNRGRIRVTVTSVQDTWLSVSVCDSGPGFSDEALAHALEPFFTTKGEEGSGLGLAMVYDAAKLLGGEVRVDNCETGAQVTLRLPLRRATPQGDVGLVLLVEDSPDLRATIREMLTGEGHSVIEAASVDEALALVQEIPEISLVLSDISLEGDKTGVDLIELLPVQSLPCYLMTSLPPSHPLHRRAVTRAPVLPKPFRAADLRAFLHSGRTAA